MDNIFHFILNKVRVHKWETEASIADFINKHQYEFVIWNYKLPPGAITVPLTTKVIYNGQKMQDI